MLRKARYITVLLPVPSPRATPSMSLARTLIQIRPHLEALLCNLSAGASLSIDATFDIASQCNNEAKCMVFALGELGHILSYVSVASDKWGHLLPMLMA